jgi:hypothetical protein
MLEFLMEQNGIAAGDLPFSQGVSKKQAKKLGEFFRVSPALFI